MHPRAGQVAVIEPQAPVDAEHPQVGPAVTGLVVHDLEGGMVIDLGVEAGRVTDGERVIASVFAPEALYRVKATVRLGSSGEVTLHAVTEIETVQRRRWPRHALALHVTLAPVDGSNADFTGVTGQTVDISMGGLRAATSRRLPAGVDPTVMIDLPGGGSLVIPACVVQADIGHDRCEYRLAFGHIPEDDARHLARLLAGTAASSRVPG